MPNVARVIPVAPWTPDQADIGGGTSIAQNVLPEVEGSYEPFPSYASVQVGPGGAGQVIGMLDVIDQDENWRTFIGTATTLYMLGPRNGTTGTGSWTDVSGGQTFHASNTTGTGWSFTQYKSLIVAVNIYDPPQVLDMQAATPAFAPMTGAPTADFCATVLNFLFFGHTIDTLDGPAELNVQRVWWSADNDPNSWPEPGSAQAQASQSDYNDFPAGAGSVRGFATNLGNATLGVFFDRAIWRGVYSGPPDVFDFYVAEGARGTGEPHSLVSVGSSVYFLANDGFMVFDGAVCTPIGFQRVDAWFKATMKPSLAGFGNVIGFYWRAKHCIVWLFPSAASSGKPDTAIIYSVGTNRWSWARLAADFAVGGAITNAPVVVGADQSMGGLTGAALAASVSTVEQEAIPGRRMWVQGARILTDGGAPSVALASRYIATSAQTIYPDSVPDDTGYAGILQDGRYLQAILKQPAGATWKHIQGVEMVGRQAGAR